MPVERPDIDSNGSLAGAKAAPAGTASAYFYRYSYIIVPILFLLQGSVSHIMVPGLYMDAVNPDYIIVRLLRWNPHIYALVLPGTCIFGIFPTIIQLYHGALPYYIGMPVYILLGTGVAAIRFANFVFASIVLLSAALFLRAFGVRPLFVGLYAGGLGARSRIFIQFQNPILHHPSPHCFCASLRVDRGEFRRASLS